jgi:hypothetical protein
VGYHLNLSSMSDISLDGISCLCDDDVFYDWMEYLVNLNSVSNS